MKLFYTFIFCLVFGKVDAQNVGIGTTTPDFSAALHINDTTKGMLIPRMTIIQRENIQNPAEGLVVYQTDSNKGFWYWNGALWIQISTTVTFDNLNLNLRRLQTQHYLNQ